MWVHLGYYESVLWMRLWTCLMKSCDWWSVRVRHRIHMGGESRQPSVPQKQTEEVPFVLPLGTTVGKTRAGTSFPARLSNPTPVATLVLHVKCVFEHRSVFWLVARTIWCAATSTPSWPSCPWRCSSSSSEWPTSTFSSWSCCRSVADAHIFGTTIHLYIRSIYKYIPVHKSSERCTGTLVNLPP